METYFLIFVIILFALAISDLVVGVSNDAVNFLNSSIGSKAAPFRTIMIIAALGVLVGATFSTGMMEVARKGIFHPDQFYFNEIMVLFLAVMITDIVLLDLFNTYGLPTSTTVSIVFELLGAAVAVALIKIISTDGGTGSLATYINSSRALGIIAGILLSVVIAFTVGAIVQYVSRIIFSFNYQQSFKYFGAIWGGVAITSITYFMLIKGLKGSAFADFELSNGELLMEWVKQHSFQILLLSFIGWTIVLQLLSMLIKLNILKFIVLIGTFALAMAFAGNDLVNFIGVPLAGFESFKAFLASGQEPGQLIMESLSGPVKTPTIFLLTAGVIMVITLGFSRKAKSVTTTTLDLSRQSEGSERFESSVVARMIIRQFIAIGNGIKLMVPSSGRKWVNDRFERTQYDQMKEEKGVSFDLIRASVNLVVASILIAIGTSLKLPLSTTYVTFMVAMGTSLADRAWGRESAVYRITGVVTVIMGWFFTAMIAFTAAFVIAFAIYYGKIFAVVFLLSLAVFFIYRTQIIHRRRSEEKKEKEDFESETGPIDAENIFTSCHDTVLESLDTVSQLNNKILEGLMEENLKKVRDTKKDIKKLNKKTKQIKDTIHATIRRLKEEDIDSGHYYVQVIDYLRETAHCLTYLADPIYMHLDNHHPPLEDDQVSDLMIVKEELSGLFHAIDKLIKSNSYDSIDDVLDIQQETLDTVQKLRKKLIKSLKKERLSTKSSMLYLEILNESKNLTLYIVNLLKAQRDFVLYRTENDK